VGSGGVNGLGPSDFLGYAEILRGGMARSRADCVDNWPAVLGILGQANEAVTACIASIVARPDRAYAAEHLREKLRRATIHSAFIQGIHAVEYCTSNGLYAHAAALVRMEIEAVEGLRGIRHRKQRDGETPRLLALRHLGRTYSQLTGLAHLSTHELLSHVVNPQIGNIDHAFNASFARHLFGTHLCAMAAFALDLAEFRPINETARLSELESENLSAVFGVLVSEGFIVMKQ
jgi:hypothetical protein